MNPEELETLTLVAKLSNAELRTNAEGDYFITDGNLFFKYTPDIARSIIAENLIADEAYAIKRQFKKGAYRNATN